MTTNGALATHFTEKARKGESRGPAESSPTQKGTHAVK